MWAFPSYIRLIERNLNLDHPKVRLKVKPIVSRMHLGVQRLQRETRKRIPIYHPLYKYQVEFTIIEMCGFPVQVGESGGV